MEVWGLAPQQVQGVVRSTHSRDALAFLSFARYEPP